MSDTANTETAADEGAKPEAGSTPETTPESPSVEALAAEIETLKSHSRKWEDRAKENYEAKKQLDEIRREQMTESEKVAADRTKSEKALADAEARALAAEAALTRYKVATEFGLSAEDVEALASVSDEAALRTLAERLAGRSTPGTRPNPAQGKSGKAAPASPAEAFAEAVSGLF